MVKSKKTQELVENYWNNLPTCEEFSSSENSKKTVIKDNFMGHSTKIRTVF